ncbi:MAG: PadR family transcriptional regulator [Gemmataceae bacterium]
MSIRHAILGLLVEGPLHGYGLKAAYEKELVPGAVLNIGQVYQALDKLEPEGLVTVEVVPQSERPDRKVYTLTDAGRAELERWLTMPSGRGLELRNESFLKLMLAWRLRASLAVDPVGVLDAERRVCLDHLHDLTAARARAEREQAPLPTLVLLEQAIQRLTGFHRWLERVEEMVRAGGRS